MQVSGTQAAGALLFLAGFIALMGIITGEIFYPSGYSTAYSEISDLGSTKPPESLIYQPSATIFNSAMIITGILTLAGTALAYRAGWNRWSALLLGIVGAGILGVGIFPGNVRFWHGLCAMITFVVGGIAAVVSSRAVVGPFRYLAAFLGCITLLSLLGLSVLMPVLGDGGVERWIAYPIIFWLTGLGGYFMGGGTVHRESGK